MKRTLWKGHRSSQVPDATMPNLKSTIKNTGCVVATPLQHLIQLVVDSTRITHHAVFETKYQKNIALSRHIRQSNLLRDLAQPTNEHIAVTPGICQSGRTTVVVAVTRIPSRVSTITIERLRRTQRRTTTSRKERLCAVLSR